MKEIFQTIIKDFHKRGIEKYKDRDITIPINSTKIITLVGSRRSGKTFLFYQIIDEILKNTTLENIIYINFEDERLDIKKEDLNFIIEAYLEIYPNKNLKDVYFFFDEIQNVQNWEKFVRRIYDTISKNIFLTGSSAKLLSQEIATSLRGRTIAFDIYPLSFKEYLAFNKIDIKDIYSTQNKAKIKSEFNNYLKCGGFAEVRFFDDNLRIKTLQNYSDVMIYRDIVERYKISNPESLKFFVKKHISNISKEVSINKTYNELKSIGLRISKDSIYLFPKYLEDIYFLFYLNLFDKSFNKQELALKKVYAIDTGLINSVSFKFSEDIGRLLENVVFIELKRRGEEIYYHKRKYECDFLIKRGLKIADVIQVTKSLLDEDTKKREIRGLVDALKAYKLKTGLILTEDEEYKIEEDGFEIKVMPIWKWMLENPKGDQK